METVLNIWKCRGLSLQGKIVTFKTLAISKVIYISYLASVPSDIVNTLENIHKNYIWDLKKPKIKHSTLIGEYSQGGLNDVDIKSKIKSLHLSWLCSLYSENKHPWMLIPNYIIKKVFMLETIFS